MARSMLFKDSFSMTQLILSSYQSVLILKV